MMNSAKKNLLNTASPALFCLFVFALSSCARQADKKKIEPSFSSISENLFENKCALYTCHSDSYFETSGNLNLSGDKAYENLVNVPGKLYPDILRVKPFDPEASLIMQRFEGKCSCGPAAERKETTPDEIAAVREWIAKGAKKD